MSEVEQDSVREKRIEMEVMVDAYDEQERAMGWYYYLEERLNFPFPAKWISRKRPNARKVTVIKMSTEDDCSNNMFVDVLYREGELEDVFLAQLSDIQPLDPDSATAEAIGDWHYWIQRGYKF